AGRGGQTVAAVEDAAEGLHDLDEADGLAALEDRADADEGGLGGGRAAEEAAAGRRAEDGGAAGGGGDGGGRAGRQGAGGGGRVEGEEEVVEADRDPRRRGNAHRIADDEAAGARGREHVVGDAE